MAGRSLFGSWFREKPDADRNVTSAPGLSRNQLHLIAKMLSDRDWSLA